MRLLLDTHILIWSLTSQNRLHQRVAAALSADENEIWLSPVSALEILTLARRGRADFTMDAEQWLAAAIRHVPHKVADLTWDTAVESVRPGLALSHWDPADRFLAATAKVLGLTLVTADERLLASTDYATLSNR